MRIDFKMEIQRLVTNRVWDLANKISALRMADMVLTKEYETKSMANTIAIDELIHEQKELMYKSVGVK